MYSNDFVIKGKSKIDLLFINGYPGTQSSKDNKNQYFN
jgi:hypothetical protein